MSSTERRVHRFDIGAMPIGRQLHAIGQPPLEIANEGFGPGRVPLAHHPIANELCVSIDTGPRPNVASATRCRFGFWQIDGPRVAEAPDLVALDAFAGQTVHALVVEVEAELAGVRQEFGDGIDRDVADPRDRTHGRSLTEHREDLDTLGYRQLVHDNI